MDTQIEPVRPEYIDGGHLLTPDELARRWSCSRAMVYRQIDAGLPSLKLGRSRRIRVADADAWVATMDVSS